jgi:hypothetical protein
MLEGYRQWRYPEQGVPNNPFKLECSFSEPASWDEIDSAWSGGRLDSGVADLWSECREALLFRDVEYGQWGLRILTPTKSAQLTTSERADRPEDIRPDDIIIGEFLGDQELLIFSPSEQGEQVVLICLPFDPRDEWYAAGASLDEFFARYLVAQGGKFWE